MILEVIGGEEFSSQIQAHNYTFYCDCTETHGDNYAQHEANRASVGYNVETFSIK